MEPRGLKKVGIATVIVGSVLGIIVPFAQFEGACVNPGWKRGVAAATSCWGRVY